MRASLVRARLLGLLTVHALAACSMSKEGASKKEGTRKEAGAIEPHSEESPDAKSEDDDAFVAASRRPNLQWKRYVAFEAGLARALALPPDALCREFGRESCIRKVHLVPLGGHDPFGTGMLEPAAEPLATTPTVVERIVLSACIKRVELDQRGENKVFGELDLSEEAPAPDDERTAQVVTDLYRRLLARDPTRSERDAVAALARAEDGTAKSAVDFAKLACFTIGSSAEALFF